MAKFRTRNQAFGLAKHQWVCQSCHRWFSDKNRHCPCGGRVFWHFPSVRQAERWMHLLLLEKAGKITDLQHEVPYPFEVNGVKIFTYRADAVYTDTRTGQVVVEDVKRTRNPKGQDPVFLLKKKCVEAHYGIIVNIVT